MHIIAKVTAGAHKNSIVEEKKDVFSVSVKEKPQRNMANNVVRELIARHFGISPRGVRIVSGHHHAHKILEISK